MNEDEIIKYLENVIKTIQESDMLFDEPANIRCGLKMSGAIQGLLDLYQKEKEKNKDLWKAYLDVSNDRDNNYVKKDKVKELFYKKRGIIEREDLQELLGGGNAKNK